MGSDQEAQAAIAALSGKEMDGRQLTVNEAKPREDRGAAAVVAEAATVAAVVDEGGTAAVAVAGDTNRVSASPSLSGPGLQAWGLFFAQGKRRARREVGRSIHLTP